MIDLQQYRATIGCFNLKVQCMLDSVRSSPTFVALSALVVLCRVIEIGQVLHSDVRVAPLAYFDLLLCYSNVYQIYSILCSRLLLCGDVESNPGPTGYKSCPQCGANVSIRSITCSCGYVLRRKKGKGSGRPKLQLGYKVCPAGRPVGTTRDAGSNVSTGRPVGTTRDAGNNVGTGRPIGTTRDAGSDVSAGRPVGTTREQGGGTNYIEDDAQKLCDHLSQYPDLTRKWNTDSASISISNELLKRGKRHIGQQV